MAERLTRQELEFGLLAGLCDVEVLALEIEHFITEGLLAAGARRQIEFDRMLDAQPQAALERERWRRARLERERRRAGLDGHLAPLPAKLAARRLAHRWGLGRELGPGGRGTVTLTA